MFQKNLFSNKDRKTDLNKDCRNLFISGCNRIINCTMWIEIMKVRIKSAQVREEQKSCEQQLILEYGSAPKKLNMAETMKKLLIFRYNHRHD